MMLGVACVMDGTVCATRCFSEKGGVSAMDKEQAQLTSFQIVGYAGDAFTHFYDAVERAREGAFDAAARELDEGEACLLEAHKAQTGMLAEEARGVDLPFSLMLVHGQDHLMTTIMFGRMARELVEVYKELRAR